MTINGIEIDPSKLLSKQELLDYLETGGGTDRSLGEIRERYHSEFGNELAWLYPISDSVHAGGSIVAVKEGFAWLPYDWVDKKHFEIYELDQAKMFDEESLEYFIDDWVGVSDDLLWAMNDMLCALKGVSPVIPAKRRMPSSRLAELFEKVIAVSGEMYEGAELYDLLHYKFGMSNQELEQQGFELQRYYFSEATKMEEITQCENALIRSFGGVPGIPEANGDLNDLQRGKIKAVYESAGKAYLGKVNYHGIERESLTSGTVLTEFTGQKVCNFQADYVVPDIDGELVDLIIQWNNDNSKIGLVGRIYGRIEQIGGVNLLWS
jgi:hypothetical protein